MEEVFEMIGIPTTDLLVVVVVGKVAFTVVSNGVGTKSQLI